MDFSKAIDIILKDLNDLGEIIDDLKQYPDVPSFQIELARSKCKGAAEVLSLLRHSEEEVREDIRLMDRKSGDDEIKKENAVKDTPEQIIFDLPEKPKPEPEIVSEKGRPKKKASETAILADQFSRLSDRFNEKLGGSKHEADISEIISTQPLKSLNDAIGINDRFHFINEVFNGSRDAYDQAINKLDMVKSLPDATAVIMSYTDSEEDSEPVKQLLDLVRRKIASHE
jgi:hypothetical protein